MALALEDDAVAAWLRGTKAQLRGPRCNMGTRLMLTAARLLGSGTTGLSENSLSRDHILDVCLVLPLCVTEMLRGLAQLLQCL